MKVKEILKEVEEILENTTISISNKPDIEGIHLSWEKSLKLISLREKLLVEVLKGLSG